MVVATLWVLPGHSLASVGICEKTVFGEQTKAARKKGFRRSEKFEFVLESCKKRVEEGHISAEATLGYMYRHGYGTPRDLEQARYWYEHAATKGSTLAALGLTHLSSSAEEASSDNENVKLDLSSTGNVSSLNELLDNEDVSTDIDCDFTAPCVIKSTALDLRLLPRVSTKLWASPAGQGTAEKVEPFKPWYVYGIQGSNRSNSFEPAWYAVGRGRAGFEGWFAAEDVIEWRHALLASYTIPTNREKIVMFDRADRLQNMVDQSSSKRTQQLDQIFSDVAAGDSPVGVVSLEPDGFVDIDDQFYLLPIVDFKPIKQLNQHALALKLVAAVPEDESENTTYGVTRALGRRPSAAVHPLCSTDDSAEVEEKAARAASASKAREILVDTVFVVDMTGSMGPYLDAVRLGIAEAIQTMSNNDISTGFRYGLVGYRDNHELINDVKFTTRLFTKKGPVKDSLLVNTLAKQVRAIKRTDDDWAEEMYAGMKLALEEFQWREGAWRVIILVGDASSHEPGHPQSTVRLSSVELRQIANELNVTVIPVYLKSRAAGADPVIARQQFQALGKNKESGASTYKEINANDGNVANELEKFAYQYWEALLAQTQDEKIQPLYGDSIDPTICSAMQTAALINYVAKNDVDDVTFWAADYDLTNPGERALQTRVLVNRRQLDNLITRLEGVLKVMQKKNQSNSSSAEQLQKILYSATSGTDDIVEEEDSHLLLPKWVRGLPYQSQLQKISIPEFVRKPAVFHREQRELIARKISYYRERMVSNAWFMLDVTSNDPYTNQAVAIPLNQLP